MHGAALPAWLALAYLASGMLFILALRGLSSPVSAQRGNRFGIAGMAIAVAATLIHYRPLRSLRNSARWTSEHSSRSLSQ
jgi:NAD(P) transhydrogenase subunit beta